MGDPSRDEFHGGGQGFQRLVGEVIPLEAAEEGFDQAVGLGTVTRSVTSDQAQLIEDLLQGIGDELWAVVDEELQPFGLVALLGKTVEERFAKEFANIMGGQPDL